MTRPISLGNPEQITGGDWRRYTCIPVFPKCFQCIYQCTVELFISIASHMAQLVNKPFNICDTEVSNLMSSTYIGHFMAIFPNNAGVQEESNSFGMSFTKMLNKVGLRLSPCLTPTRVLKNGEIFSHPRTATVVFAKHKLNHIIHTEV